MWKVVAIRGSYSGHDVHGFFDSSSNKVPSRGLRDEGEDKEEEYKGGN